MVESYKFGRSAQPYDLPIIGDAIAKTNHIIDLWSDPCAPSAEVWAYAFFQSIPTFIISVTKPELIDVDIRHKGRKPRKGKKLRFVGDVLFRDNIVTVPLPRWVPFRIFEWTQRLGWYFLIADATADLAINWMSLAYQWTGCDTAQSPPRWDSNVPITSSINGLVNGWYRIPWTPTEFHEAANATPPYNFEILKPCVPRFIFEGSTRPFPLNPNAQMTKWRIRNDQNPIIDFETNIPPDLGVDTVFSMATPPLAGFPAHTKFGLDGYFVNGPVGTPTGLKWNMRSAVFPYLPNIGPDP